MCNICAHSAPGCHNDIVVTTQAIQPYIFMNTKRTKYTMVIEFNINRMNTYEFNTIIIIIITDLWIVPCYTYRRDEQHEMRGRISIQPYNFMVKAM